MAPALFTSTSTRGQWSVISVVLARRIGEEDVYRLSDAAGPRDLGDRGSGSLLVAGDDRNLGVPGKEGFTAAWPMPLVAPVMMIRMCPDF
jgi:hypothetical protein